MFFEIPLGVQGSVGLHPIPPLGGLRRPQMLIRNSRLILTLFFGKLLPPSN
jgi:hypothetical protein